MSAIGDKFLQLDTDKRNRWIGLASGLLFTIGIGWWVYKDYLANQADLLQNRAAADVVSKEEVKVETKIFEADYFARLAKEQYKQKLSTLNASPQVLSLEQELSDAKEEKETIEQAVQSMKDKNDFWEARFAELEKQRSEDKQWYKQQMLAMGSELTDNMSKVVTSNSQLGAQNTVESDLSDSPFRPIPPVKETNAERLQTVRKISIFSTKNYSSRATDSALSRKPSEDKIGSDTVTIPGVQNGKIDSDSTRSGTTTDNGKTAPRIYETELSEEGGLVDPYQDYAMDANKKTKDLGKRIPGHSVIGGVLFTGMDAPASPTAVDNPHPGYVKITKIGKGPNGSRFDLRGCHVEIAGFGDLSTHRVNAKTTNMSCVRKDGIDVFVKIKATVTGSDGKTNLRGKLETRDGAYVAATLTSGTLAAAANLIRPSTIITGQGTTSVESAFKEAVGEGGDKGLNRLADRYAKTADQMYPFIVLDAGREVTLVLQEPLVIDQ